MKRLKLEIMDSGAKAIIIISLFWLLAFIIIMLFAII